MVASAIVGPPPNIPPASISPENVENIEQSPEWKEYMEKYEQKMNEYREKKFAIQSIFNILSPSSNYLTIVNSLSSSDVILPFRTKDVTKNIVGFVILPIIFFVLSYVKFLRMEIT